MGMMGKMRSLAPAFIITVGALFVLFMVISDSNVLEALGGRTNVIGSVNGDDISYQEFQNALERQREITKQQTGEEIPDEQYEQFRQQVWDALVTQKLLEQEIDKMDLTVTNKEIEDAILGDEPPAFLKQNFIDSLGNFNRELYEQAIFDPQNEQVLLQAEEYVRQQRLNEKLQSLLLASITVSREEIERKFKEQNIYLNAKFAIFPVQTIPDSLLNITDEELREYYENNSEQFKVEEQRKLKFVLFRNEPSKTDSELVYRNLESVKNSFLKDTADFSYYVNIYSDLPHSVDTLDPSAFKPEAVDSLINAEDGSIIGPVSALQGYALYHRIDFISSDESFVKASHILINDEGDDEKNLAEANRLYELLISGENFNELAGEHSNDPGSARLGGALGWFGKGRMVKEFEEASFNGKVGEITKPVKSNFGYHIIKIENRISGKFVVEQIVNSVKQSAASLDANYTAASDFSYLAEKNGFEKEAELMGYEIKETALFTDKSITIPGIGTSRRLLGFTFDNGLDDISDVHKVPTGFVVAKIAEIMPEGVRDFEDVKVRIKQQVLNDKKYEAAKKLADNILERVDGKFEMIPQLDPRIQILETGRINKQSNVPVLGNDYAFINAAFSLDKGEISEPVKGMKGYYIISVTEKTEFDSSAFSMQESTIRNNILQERKNAYVNNWLQNMKEKADIVDNRHLFYSY
jgi:parvulin-like peptidyl-prolyl isomerase